MDLPALNDIRLELDDAVLTIELHRPDALNALTVGLVDELREALRAAEDPDVRAVVLTGAGRAFSSGADLKQGGAELTPSGRPDLAGALRASFNWPVRQLRALPKPVVAALNGPAVGIAVSYALACDAVIAVPESYLLLSFVNVGLVPDGGASVLIPARAGAARFAALALFGERLPAADAHAAGLVDRVEEDARGGAQGLARTLADGPNGAQARIKRLVNEGPLAGLEAALEREATLQGEQAEGPEFLEGVTAFLQKRKPSFRGVLAP